MRQGSWGCEREVAQRSPCRASGFSVRAWVLLVSGVQCAGCKIWGVHRVDGLERVGRVRVGLGFRRSCEVFGAEFGVEGLGFGVENVGFRV
jgi:hypothetical protein